MTLTATQRDGPYLALYHKAKQLHWDPAAVDLSQDKAQWARIKREHEGERYPEQILRLTSLFYEGEESVTRTLAPFCSAVSRAGLGVDKEMFLTTQLYEEAKHFEFFARYFREVFREDGAITRGFITPAPQAVLLDDLEEVTERLRREEDPTALVATFAEAVTHYMGVVEAMLARTGYVGAHDALATRGWLPGLQEGFRLIKRDEGRHVAFGMRVIAELTTDRPELRATVAATFERHLPNVLATVGEFDYPQPLVDIDKLGQYALAQYQRFAAAAGLEGETLDPAEFEAE
ncbi:MAG: ribonucleotide-diphosphate reductase subunit beta [Gemmatimonadetes bacterium]|nr:ribonucleotide-diphosphate reductase subunit beta [Gemmatimonadota bacterium]